MALATGYYATRDRLRQRLTEPAPGRVQFLTGPRQVGKTTLLLELAQEWGERAIYLAADAPETALSGWWEAQWRRARQRAATGKAVLLLDEVQYLPGWSRLVKAAVDQVHREHLPLHLVVTGSAALALGSNARETMAGRYERLALRQWQPQDLAQAFLLSREQAVETYVRFGSFPGAMPFLSDLPRWQAYLRDSIVEPAVGRDLLALEQVRKPALLRQIFAVCVGHPAEILSLAKIAGALTDPGTLETIAHYLSLLEEAYLVAPVRKFSTRELRRRASPAKVVPLSNALLHAGPAAAPPAPGHDPESWGRWVENACLAFAVGSEQTVHYWRQEPLEVDAVISGSWGQWAIEIKTGAYSVRDLAGLLEFCRRYPTYQPLVLGDPSHLDIARSLGVEARSWVDYLWAGMA